ncbi:sucrase ferredoxin [Nocardioides jishulii]|uniref:Sucrase ferredoxin n=1 Tax=Nocardioides jishulii TaxID=2575440 RepID=A0A4U2YST0_9ACTN|nr:sucrase ferredoxin [Nocardioides jishulii]QCX26350.1 sucrase ferredoxin [Nocardioides jishulii]TKI63845.1 sucrase ferredoxin [Nocardioides jishulii]
MVDTFRCTAAARQSGEPMVGTAPTDAAYLLVEYAGAWGRKALAESRLPDAVKAHLDSDPGVRVLLVRRHGGTSGPGVRIFAVQVTPADARIETTVLDDAEALLEVDVARLGRGELPGWEAYDAALHLVCTNGRRDLCCAELGRPVAAALAERWPEETWEVTHLGGHRFASTLLSFPSAVCLGRLDEESAVLAVEELEAGRHPVGFTRGRVGAPEVAQVAQVHVVEQTCLDRLGEVQVVGEDRGIVHVDADGEAWQVAVRTSRSAPRRQSCGETFEKPATVFEVLAAGPTG